MHVDVLAPGFWFDVLDWGAPVCRPGVCRIDPYIDSIHRGVNLLDIRLQPANIGDIEMLEPRLHAI